MKAVSEQKDDCCIMRIAPLTATPGQNELSKSGRLRSSAEPDSIEAASGQEADSCIMCIAPLTATPGQIACKAALPCCKVSACEPCTSKWLSVCIRNGMHPTCPGGTCGILPESFLQNSDLITQQDRSKYFKLTPQAERTQNAAPEPFFQRMSNRMWLLWYTTPCPFCGVIIQKAGGCNSMSCSQCRGKFCFRCGKGKDPPPPPLPGRGGTQRFVRAPSCHWWCKIVDLVYVLLVVAAGVCAAVCTLYLILSFFSSTFASFFHALFWAVGACFNVIGIFGACVFLLELFRTWASLRAQWPRLSVDASSYRLVTYLPGNPPPPGSTASQAGVSWMPRDSAGCIHVSPRHPPTHLRETGLLQITAVPALLFQGAAAIFGLSAPPGGRFFLWVLCNVCALLLGWVLFERLLESRLLRRAATLEVKGVHYTVCASTTSNLCSRARPASWAALSRVSRHYTLTPCDPPPNGEPEPSQREDRRESEKREQKKNEGETRSVSDPSTLHVPDPLSRQGSDPPSASAGCKSQVRAGQDNEPHTHPAHTAAARARALSLSPPPPPPLPPPLPPARARAPGAGEKEESDAEAEGGERRRRASARESGKVRRRRGGVRWDVLLEEEEEEEAGKGRQEAEAGPRKGSKGGGERLWDRLIEGEKEGERKEGERKEGEKKEGERKEGERKGREEPPPRKTKAPRSWREWQEEARSKTEKKTQAVRERKILVEAVKFKFEKVRTQAFSVRGWQACVLLPVVSLLVSAPLFPGLALWSA